METRISTVQGTLLPNAEPLVSKMKKISRLLVLIWQLANQSDDADSAGLSLLKEQDE